MKQRQHSTEEIIRILRQAGGDDTVDAICREPMYTTAKFDSSAETLSTGHRYW